MRFPDTTLSRATPRVPGWSLSRREYRPTPEKGPLFVASLFVIRFEAEDMIAMPSPPMAPIPPMLSRAVIPETVLCDPPSIATPMSKARTVPFVTVTPVRLRTKTPAPSRPFGVPTMLWPFRLKVMRLAPITTP